MLSIVFYGVANEIVLYSIFLRVDHSIAQQSYLRTPSVTSLMRWLLWLTDAIADTYIDGMLLLDQAI